MSSVKPQLDVQADFQNPARRNFLLGAGAATVAGAAAITVVRQKPATVKTSKASVPAGQGYQLSEHVRSYYRTTAI